MNPADADSHDPSRNVRVSGRAIWHVAPLAFVLCVAACRTPAPTPSGPLAAEALVPSPRLIVGRIVAVETAQKFAFVELAADAPSAALVAGTELIVRTLELRETGRIQASAYVRGRTLGTKIIGGQPSPGDEVVWLAP